MKKIMEIRAAEGGNDSKLFVEDLATSYEKTFLKLGWKSKRLSQRSGFISIEVNGTKLNRLNKESGGHRIQRVPPTETKGRVHTSTVTVAILDNNDIADEKYLLRDDHHYYYELFKSTGCGGQKKNKTLSAIKCIHIPTGIKQERDSRSQSKNKIDSRLAVDKILDSMLLSEQHYNRNTQRSSLVGSGMRGDKIRTYRFQDDKIIDHASNKTVRLKSVMRGNMDKLWKNV